MNNPQHIALIMDGNRRWAREHHVPGFVGHRRGVHAAIETIRAALRNHISYLSLFAFSTENWNRSATEVTYLMGLFQRTIDHFFKWVRRYNIAVRFIGDRSVLNSRLQQQMQQLEGASQDHPALTLIIAINYGSRDELIRALQSIHGPITWGLLTEKLDTHGIPDVDLVIRTSGEQRLSNFLLLQSAYAEIIFLKKWWPDFAKADFDAALFEYQQRKRNFGR